MLITDISNFLDAKIYNPLNLELNEQKVFSLTSLCSAENEQLSFYDGSRPLDELLQTKAGAVILNEEKKELKAIQLICKNPKQAMVKALSLFLKKKKPSHEGKSQQAFIHPEATIDPTATIFPLAFIDRGAKVGAHSLIYPHAYIGEEVTIGDHCIIYPNATLLNACELGNHIVVHPGAVIGTDGFGFIPTGAELQKVPQIGKVIIEDHVQVGSLSSIDSATFDKTLIKKGSKIDSLVKIGHNVTVGEHAILCSQVGMSGGVVLGDHVIVAGQAGFSNSITIDSHTTIGGRAGVINDLKKGTYHGYPAIDAKEWRRMILAQKRLPEIMKNMRQLQKQVEALQEKISEKQ